MELVDILNKRNEYTGEIKDRKALIENEYRNLVHVWIINDKKELLIQQRSFKKKHFPGLWSVTSGCVDSKESLVEACIRECKEELNVELDINNLEYMMSFKKDPVIVQVFVLYQNIDISKIILQEEEVSNMKFVTREELKTMMIENKTAGSINYFEFFEKILDKNIE